jgi:hypothetical protein
MHVTGSGKFPYSRTIAGYETNYFAHGFVSNPAKVYSHS